MEINLFSKCIKDLIVENDKVDVPYLGTFTAEMMPASYSDKQTTIHPPYRKMSFHKGDISLAEGTLLLEKVRRETGVSMDQAGVELGWCLSRLCSELEGRKSCKLPGLGTMRANARNEFFFVPDDDLDIWPDGVGFDAISIKVSEKEEEMPGQAGHDEPFPGEPAEIPEQPEPLAAAEVVDEPAEEVVEAPAEEIVVAEVEVVGGLSDGEPANEPEQPEPPVAEQPERLVAEVQEQPQPSPTESFYRFETEGNDEEHGWNWLKIILIALLILLLLFIAASYLFTDQMSPILDRLLYTKEELELWRG